MENNLKYHFIVVGWNCELYVRECIESILKQTPNQFDIYIMDDCSDDNTWDILQNEYSKNPIIHLFRTKSNMGAAYTRFQLLNQKNFNDEDVAILIDMDDYIEPITLNYINKIYTENPNIELTYGIWRNLQEKVGRLVKYDDEILKNKKFEEAGLHATHLRTFKIKLIQGMTPFYFQIDNKWIKNATDVALMIYVLKKASYGSIYPIGEILYNYRQNHDNVTLRRFTREEKFAIAKQIRNNYKQL